MTLNLGASCHQFCTLDSVRVLNLGCLLSPWLVYSGHKLLYLHLPILPLDLNLGYLLSPWLVYSGHKLHFPILPLDLMYSPNSNKRFFLIFATSAQYALLALSMPCWRLVCPAGAQYALLAPSMFCYSVYFAVGAQSDSILKILSFIETVSEIQWCRQTCNLFKGKTN